MIHSFYSHSYSWQDTIPSSSTIHSPLHQKAIFLHPILGHMRGLPAIHKSNLVQLQSLIELLRNTLLFIPFPFSLPHITNPPCHVEYHCDIYDHWLPIGLCRLFEIALLHLALNFQLGKMDQCNNHLYFLLVRCPGIAPALVLPVVWSPSLSITPLSHHLPRFSSITTRRPAKSNEMEIGCYPWNSLPGEGLYLGSFYIYRLVGICWYFSSTPLVIEIKIVLLIIISIHHWSSSLTISFFSFIFLHLGTSSILAIIL